MYGPRVDGSSTKHACHAGPMFVGPHVSQATSARSFILDPRINHIAYKNGLALSILQESDGLNHANY